MKTHNYSIINNVPNESSNNDNKELRLIKSPTITTNSGAEDDGWLGVVSKPTRLIPGTPFYLSRLSKATEPENHGLRLNPQGYDRDDPQDAIVKYETNHPKPFLVRTWQNFKNACSKLFASLVSKTNAVGKKNRIDQKVMLRIVRESVDKFPELKIRLKEEAFNLLDVEDQMRFRQNMAVIRQAQHDYIANELAKVYPGHINQDAPTILYTGGRAAGCLRILYCSMDEYVALYWSEWGLMSVDSGAYKAHVYDYITEGNNKNWNAKFLNYDPKNYENTEPGEYTFLGEGNRKIWSFEGPCGMVDHGLGNIPSMAPFAILNNVTTTSNYDAIKNLVSNQAKAVAYEYWQRLKEFAGNTHVAVNPVTKVSEEELTTARNYFRQISDRAHLNETI